MECKLLNIVLFTIFFSVLNTSALPRDSTAVKVEPVLHNIHDDTIVKDFKVELPEHARNVINIPGRVSCQFEDTTEDPICEEHCFPKGYKYGLCVSGICSCV